MSVTASDDRLRSLVLEWRRQADDYMRLHRNVRCGCAAQAKEGYLKAALQLRSCADELEALFHVERIAA